MPRVSITEDNRAGTGVDRFAQLKLATGEKARFVVFGEPWMEWVHDLKAPLIENGVAVMEERQRKNGPAQLVNKTEFLRRSICLGTPAALEDKRADPDNCPACAAAASGDVEAAVQRYAVTVARYTLRGSTWQVMDPFGMNVLIWPATARKWDELINLANKLGNLKEHDLTLDCEDGNWQRTTLSFELDAAWKSIPGAANYIRTLLSTPENLPTEAQLQDACGSVPSRAYMQQDVDLIVSRWRQVRNAGSGTAALPAAQSVDLAGGLDSLLGTPGTTPPPDPFAQDPFASLPAAAYQQPPHPNGAPVTDPFGGVHPGGMQEFAPQPSAPAPAATPEQLAAIQAAKAQAQRDLQAVISPGDPFAGLPAPPPAPGPPTAPVAPAPDAQAPAQAPAQPSSISFDDIFKIP